MSVFSLLLSCLSLASGNSVIFIFIMPGRNGRLLTNIKTGTSSQRNMQVSVRAARFGLVLGRSGAELVCLIAEEGSETDESPIFISLKHIVLRLRHLPQGHTRTAGKLEVFFDFLTLVADISMGSSHSTVGDPCRSILIILANLVHETGSPCLIPPLDLEMMIIIFRAITDWNIRRTLFDF